MAEANRRNGHFRLLVLICAATLMIEGLDLQLIAFAAPQILHEFGVDRAALAPAFAAALGGMMIGSVAGGLLGDRVGRRPAILASVAVFGAMTLSCAGAHSLAQLVLLRLIGGIGFGAVFPNILSLVAEFSQTSLSSTPVIITTIGAPLGGMVGAFVTSWAIPALGWRTCFFVAGALTVLLCGALLGALPESPALLLRRAGDGQMLTRTATDPSAPHGKLGPRSPLRRLFGRDLLSRTLGLSLLSFTFGYASYLYLQWTPALLTQAGLSLRLAILGSFFFNLASVAATLVMALLLARHGSRRSLLLAQIVYIGATVLLALFLTGSLADGRGMATIGIMASLILSGCGCGCGGGGALAFTLSVALYPVECRATGSGLTTGLVRLGALLSAFGGALLLRLGGDSPAAFLAGAVAVLAIGMGGTILIDAHTPAVRGRSRTAARIA